MPSFTFYATRRGDRHRRRDARCSATSTPTPATSRPTRSRPAARRRAPRRSSPSTCSAVRRRSPELRALGLPVLEDAAQAAGASLDGVAPARSATSPRSRSTRPRTSAASATAARSPPTTTTIAELARALRFHGSRDKQTFEYVGYNSRLDELQAAILRVLLPRARRLVDGRRAAARRLRRRRASASTSTLPVAPAGAEPAWHLYVVDASARRRADGGARRRGTSRRAPTTARRFTASRRWRRIAARRPRAAGRPTSWRGPTSRCR